MQFVGFVLTLFGVELTAGQRVLCSVSFDGTQPCDLRESDRDLAHRRFGDVDEIPDSARRGGGGLWCPRWKKLRSLCAAGWAR